MNVSPEKYLSISAAQHRDATEILRIVTQDLGPDGEAPVIVDVGCGSGNVTKLMAETIPHQRILSLDIVPEMVEATRIVNQDDPTFDFLVQDISLPWDELDPKLTQLEGQVDLVWSNRVLHWVLDDLRPRAARNIARLLKPGGRIYVNTTFILDFTKFLPEDEKEANKNLMKIPSRQEQHDNWAGYFKGAGLENVQVEFLEKNWKYETHEQYLVPGDMAHILRRYVLEPRPESENEKELMERLRNFFLRSFAQPLGQTIRKSFEGALTYYYGQFRITGAKP